MHAHTMTVATQHGQARLTTPPSSSSWNLSLSDADPAAADVSRVRSACAIMLPGIIPCSPASALSLLLSPGIDRERDVFFSKVPRKTQKTKTSRRTRECFMQPQIAAAPAPVSALHKGWSSALKKAKVVAHYGFVPLVLYLGFQSEGQPGFLQLFLPFA